MSIFLNENSKVIVQGMTGSEGMKHTSRMLASGTAIVGGVNPKKAGESVEFDGGTVPVFGSVAEAMKETGADVSVIFVPAKFTKSAVIEAVDAGIPLAVCITEGVPVKDTAEFFTYAQQSGTTTGRPSRTPPPPTRWRPRPRRRTSTTSSSTARSASSATAPGSS